MTLPCCADAEYGFVVAPAVNLLNVLSVWIISTHIRSRALLFLYKVGGNLGHGGRSIVSDVLSPSQYFFQVVLFTFYRNLVSFVLGKNSGRIPPLTFVDFRLPIVRPTSITTTIRAHPARLLVVCDHATTDPGHQDLLQDDASRPRLREVIRRTPGCAGDHLLREGSCAECYDLGISRLAVDLAFRDEFSSVISDHRSGACSSGLMILVFEMRTCRYLSILRLQLRRGSLYVSADISGYGCDLGEHDQSSGRSGCRLMTISVFRRPSSS